MKKFVDYLEMVQLEEYSEEKELKKLKVELEKLMKAGKEDELLSKYPKALKLAKACINDNLLGDTKEINTVWSCLKAVEDIADDENYDI
jgi:hypothetical protein